MAFVGGRFARKLIRGAALSTALMVALLPAASGAAVPPILAERCTNVAGYSEFRAALTAAVSSRDRARLIDLFMEGSSISAAGMRGDARHMLGQMDQAEAAQIWSILEEILSLGCAPRKDKILLPSMALLIYDDDQSDMSIALRSTLVFKDVKPGAATIGRLEAGQEVRDLIPDNPKGWTRVMFKGREGFVHAADIRSAYDYQLQVERVDGRWLINEFIPGV